MLQKFFLKKEDRLSQKKTIQRVFQEGVQINYYPYKIFSLKVKKSLKSNYQFLISVPVKRFKNAVDRNLIKRRIKEAYRINKSILTEQKPPAGTQIAIAFVYVADEIHNQDYIQMKMIESLKKVVLMIDNQDV